MSFKKYNKPTSPKKTGNNQPDKNSEKKENKIKEKENKINKQKIYKSQNVIPSKNSSINENIIRKNDTPKQRKHPEYGTSKLEDKFVKNILKKCGVEFQYQFKAESIGRYFDFYIPEANTIIEINGGYWHSDPRLYEGKELTPVQKKNQKVDKWKKKWADEHRIPIYYFWEKDINENPEKVLIELREIIKKEKDIFKSKQDKKNRPNK